MVTTETVLQTLSTIMWVVIVLGIVGAILWFIFYWRKYNKQVLVLDQTSGGNIVREDKAKEFYDEKNVLCWKIRKEKTIMAHPPKDALMIKDGKKFAVLVRIQGDQYHWMNAAEFKQDAEAKLGKYFVIAEDAKRQLADQIKKAESEKSTKLNQLLTQMIPFIAIGILLIGGYFIYDVAGTKMTEMSENLASVSGQMAEVAKQNGESLKLINSMLNSSNTVGPTPTVIVNPGRVPN